MTRDQFQPTASIALVLGGGSLLSQVGRELNTLVERMLAPLDLTAQQAALLVHANAREVSPSELLDSLGTDTAGMTKLVDRLVAKGLLVRRRHPEDRRAVLLAPTEQGQALVPRILPVFGRATTVLLAGFVDEEITQLNAMLRRMLDNLGTDE